MEQLIAIIDKFNYEIIIGLIFAFLILLILYIIAEIRISHVTDKYNALVKDVEPVNLENLILKSLENEDELEGQLAKIQKDCDELEKKFKFSIQKVGFVRYNAFADMGSELSFSIALLDYNLNGVVFTSIYGRDNSTVYAKMVEKGESRYPLSVEEMQAIDRAIKSTEEAGASGVYWYE